MLAEQANQVSWVNVQLPCDIIILTRQVWKVGKLIPTEDGLILQRTGSPPHE